jgi:hypothetical protein
MKCLDGFLYVPAGTHSSKTEPPRARFRQKHRTQAQADVNLRAPQASEHQHSGGGEEHGRTAYRVHIKRGQDIDDENKRHQKSKPLAKIGSRSHGELWSWEKL